MTLLAISWPAASLALSEKDDRGKTIRLVRHVARIVTLAPNLTDLAFAAGAGGKLVGVSNYSDYPAAAKQLPPMTVNGDHMISDVIRLKLQAVRPEPSKPRIREARREQ